VSEETNEFALTSESDTPANRSGARRSIARRVHEAAIESDAELLVAMRAGRERALRSFYVHFRPVLLLQAYRLGVPTAMREEVVTEFLGDIALKLIAAPVMPTALAAYVITAFRHAVVSAHRSAKRSAARSEAVETVVGEGAGEHVVKALCSAYTLRAVDGGATDDDEMRTTIRALAERLLGRLSELDRELLVWIGESVPSTAIAAWRGCTANSVKVKISRLRARLRTEAAAYVGELEGEGRDELERLFRRAGVVKRVTHGDPAEHPFRLISGSEGRAVVRCPPPYGMEDV
jgi:DNA-directed RNA polymerase specialized sigma24 family protein